MKPVGILGGTFDPVHHGHLRLAIEFMERLDLMEVRFIPLHIPPHRSMPFASATDRLHMLEIATRGIPDISIDDFEIRQKKVSYTIDTVTAFRESMKDAPVCLLLGADAFNNISTWKNWDSILDYVHITVAKRPEYPVEAPPAVFENAITQSVSALHQQPCGLISMIDMPLLDISATQVRSLVKSGNRLQGLLPPEVIEYIYTNKLYSGGE